MMAMTECKCKTQKAQGRKYIVKMPIEFHICTEHSTIFLICFFQYIAFEFTQRFLFYLNTSRREMILTSLNTNKSSS